MSEQGRGTFDQNNTSETTSYIGKSGHLVDELISKKYLLLEKFKNQKNIKL